MDERQACIDAILDDLRTLGTSASYATRAAVDANVEFFRAIRTRRGYLAWLMLHAWRLPPNGLLELTDFGLPRWNQAMHAKLIEVERRPFPGLVRPLVERIMQVIEIERKLVLLLDIGCGGMEVERQVLHRLLAHGPRLQTVFVGVEKLPIVQRLAMENLSPLRKRVNIVQVETLDGETLAGLMKRNPTACLVVLCQNNIFELETTFPAGTFDLAFHSLFAHHLSIGEKERITQVAKTVAKRVLEYDGLRSWLLMVPQSLTGWPSPAFMNAVIFSNLRCRRKREVRRSTAMGGARLSFHVPPGTYLLDYRVSPTDEPPSAS